MKFNKGGIYEIYRCPCQLRRWGGECPLNASAIQAKAFALFTKNQRQWTAPPLSEMSIAKFKNNCAKLGYSSDHILAHDSYLINLGNPDKDKHAQSLSAFLDELWRCSLLGVKLLNFHPGSHLKVLSEDDCLKLIAESVRHALEEVPDVVAVFENTAGQGTNVGYSFEHLARLLELVDMPDRTGVCLDTCHAFAAGYDIKDAGNYEKVMADFDRIVGFANLRGVHLNDSKGTLGSHLDRHNSIGMGTLGNETFERIMKDPRFDNIPIILETIDDTIWKQEIAQLYSWCE